MTTAENCRARVRKLLSMDQCVHPGSVFDPLSARIAEDLGFETGMFAGSTASLTVLGAPDIIVLTLSEFATQCRRICRAGTLPLLVDADHGYGNAMNVQRTVQELENAGVSALTIEDTTLPQTYGDKGPAMLSIDEGVGKMRAALSGRSDKRLVIAGRTSAAQLSDINDAIARCQAYESVGVDMLMLVGIETRADLEKLSAATHLPLMLGSLSPELKDKRYLASHRVRIALQGHQPLMAGVEAVYQTLKALRDGISPADLLGIADKERMAKVTRKKRYDRETREFLEL